MAFLYVVCGFLVGVACGVLYQEWAAWDPARDGDEYDPL